MEVVGTFSHTEKRPISIKFLQDGIEDPKDPYLVNGPEAELASFISGPPGMVDDAYSSAPVEIPYHSVCSNGNAVVWSAKFYLWDHPELKRLWQNFCYKLTHTASTSSADEEDTSPEDESASPEEKDSATVPSVRIGVSAEIEGGDPIPNQFFSRRDIVQGYRFEVGVLFVHGIGPHQKRETLVQIGEPILHFWRGLLDKASLSAGKRLDPKKRKEWCDRVRVKRLKNRQDNEGVMGAVEGFEKQVHSHSNDKPADSHLFRCGHARVKDTVVEKTADPRLPASSLIRLSSLYEDTSLRESHVVLSEAWWTDKVIPYSFMELTSWICEVLPTAAHLDISGSMLAAKRIGESAGPWYWRVFCRISAISILATIPLRLAFAVLMFPILLLIGSTSLAPLRPVKLATSWLVDTLMGTVGQSHVLTKSPIRRNAIVRSVAGNLEWMEENCEKIVVIAHSQGAEIARLVSQSRRWPLVERWISFGPAIKPLNMLDSENLKKTCSIKQRFSSPSYQLRGSTDAFTKWRNYYTAHDPVSAGGLEARKGELSEAGITTYEEYEIQNRCSVISDHTSYHKNIEQFIAPIASEIFDAAMGAEINPPLGQQSANRERPSSIPHKRWNERKKLVQTWLNCRIIAIIIVLCGAVYTLLIEGKATEWWGDILATWEGNIGFFSVTYELTVGPAAQIIGDLWLIWVILAAYLFLIRQCVRKPLKQNQSLLLEDLAERLAAKGKRDDASR